jgi:hypothetical protein
MATADWGEPFMGLIYFGHYDFEFAPFGRNCVENVTGSSV